MILAAVSGGLDSVTMAYKLLSETDEPIHIHHISLRRSHDRWKAEDAAMERIVPWLRENTRDFGYSTSVHRRRHYQPDIVIVTQVCGQIARKMPVRPSLARGANAHDMSDGSVGSRQRQALRKWQFAWSFRDVPPIIFPIGHMTRADCWAYLPDDLRVMTTSCRKPWEAGPVYTPCETCHACRGLIENGVPLERDIRCEAA